MKHPFVVLGLLTACPSALSPPNVVDLLDLDSDGYYGLPGGNDCDDADPSTHPEAEDETCDGVDNDCYHQDGPDDRDGDGATVCGGDCDDADPDRSPAAAERCNQRDDDCDGAPDEDFDQDGDGHFACDGPLVQEPRSATFTDDAVRFGPPLVAVDINSDGLTEVVTATSPFGQLRAVVVLQPWTGCDLCAFTELGVPPNTVALLAPAGDANGDGMPDLLMHAATPAGGVYRPGLLLGGPAPAFADGTWATPADNPWTLYAPLGDLNEDGRTDQALVFGAASGVPYEVSLGQFGDDAFSITASGWITDDDLTLPDTTHLHTADLNGDGWPELVLSGPSTDARPWLIILPGTMLGPTVVGATTVSVPGRRSASPVELVTGGDLDGDGLGDLVVHLVYEGDQGLTPALQVLYGASDGLRQGPMVPIAVAAPYRARILPDVDGDGRDELIVLTEAPLDGRPFDDSGSDTGIQADWVQWMVEVWSVAPEPTRRQAFAVGNAEESGPYEGLAIGDLDGDHAAEVVVIASGSWSEPGFIKVFRTVSDCDDANPAIWSGCP